jgi:hypothetical protein
MDITKDDRDAIVAFLEALTDKGASRL